jgi:hypothetical protein
VDVPIPPPFALEAALGTAHAGCARGGALQIAFFDRPARFGRGLSFQTQALRSL